MGGCCPWGVLFLGGGRGGGLYLLTPQTRNAGGTYPTGMHSCLSLL